MGAIIHRQVFLLCGRWNRDKPITIVKNESSFDFIWRIYNLQIVDLSQFSSFLRESLLARLLSFSLFILIIFIKQVKSSGSIFPCVYVCFSVLSRIQWPQLHSLIQYLWFQKCFKQRSRSKGPDALALSKLKTIKKCGPLPRMQLSTLKQISFCRGGEMEQILQAKKVFKLSSNFFWIQIFLIPFLM